MSEQVVKALPVRPGFPYKISFSPRKIDPDNPAFPAGGEWQSRITTDPTDPTNGGAISSTGVEPGITRVDDNTLALCWPADITSTLDTSDNNTIAAFDIVRCDAGNEAHLNITVEIPVVESITPPK